MRTKSLIAGLRNNQKIRVICDGVGFVTTVAGAFDMVFTHQRIAVCCVLGRLSFAIRDALDLGKDVPRGFGCRQRVYGPDNKIVDLDIQIDLLT